MAKNNGFVKMLAHDQIGSFLPLRKDFVMICGGNITQALILGVLEKKTNERATRCVQQLSSQCGGVKIDQTCIGESDLFVRMPSSIWEQESYGALSKFLVAKEMPFLVKAGFIEVKRYPEKRDKAIFYLLKLEAISKAIDNIAAAGKIAGEKCDGEIFDDDSTVCHGKKFDHDSMTVKKLTDVGQIIDHGMGKNFTDDGQKVDDVIYRFSDSNRYTDQETLPPAQPSVSPSANNASPSAQHCCDAPAQSNNPTESMEHSTNSFVIHSEASFKSPVLKTDLLSSSVLCKHIYNTQDLPVRRPDASRENEFLNDTRIDEGGVVCAEPFGFVVGTAAGCEEPDGGPAPKNKKNKAADGAEAEPYVKREWLGVLPDDPDVEDPSVRSHKQQRRADEPKKKRRPAFKATLDPYPSADIWVSLINERFEFGEYPDHVTSEIISVTGYWIRALYIASPEIAVRLIRLDEWPQIMSGVLSAYGKTASDIMAISDFIRSTAGAVAPRYDWSARVKSPKALHDVTKQGERYIDYLLALSKQHPGKKGAINRSMGVQPERPQYYGGVDMNMGERVSEWRGRMRETCQPGLLWAFIIEGAHQSGDFSKLQDIPQELEHFISEYRIIVGWQGEKEN